MTVAAFIEQLKADPSFMANVSAMREIPANPASYADFPPQLDERVAEVLRQRGISQLYSHQRQALDLAFAGMK